MKDTRTIFTDACNKIAGLLHDKDFKASKTGQVLKKVAMDKDFIFEIEFQSITKNTNSHIVLIPWISISSKKLKKWMMEQTNNPYESGVIVAEQLSYITPLKTAKSWNLAGMSGEKYIQEIAELLNKYALPIFDLFNNTNAAIDFLAASGQQFNEYMDDSLRPLDFMICFAPKEKAEQFFNRFIVHCKYKAQIFGLYKSLENCDEIDFMYSEFLYAKQVKLAYANGLKISK